MFQQSNSKKIGLLNPLWVVFMGEDRVRNASITVGTSAVLISEKLQLGQRKALTLTNTSTAGQIITITFAQYPTATGAGIVLYPAGSWSESLDSAFIPNNGEIWAISSGANGTLAVHERIN